MLQNLSEDYVLHMQNHNVLIGVLMLAVPSHLESMYYTHNGKLEDHVYHLPWSRETNKFFNVEDEDILSLLQKLSRGVSVDVESFSVISPRTNDFIHHDGEMFEVVFSSNPDSPTKEQDNYSDVKQDITKKRNAVLASGLAYYQGSPLSVEDGLSVNILPTTVLHQFPDIAYLCGCLAQKTVQDPFVNTLGPHYDDGYIFRDDLVKGPALNISDGLAAIHIHNRHPEDYRQDFALEEALIIGDTLRSLDTGTYFDGLQRACVGGMMEEQALPNITRPMAFSEQESIADVLSTGQLQNIEKFEMLAAKETAFMQLNNEGLSENGYETAFVLECPNGMQPCLTLPVMTANVFLQLSKWELPNAGQLMEWNLYNECTEGRIFETEKIFLETLTHRLHVPNLREKIVLCSAVADAIHRLHHTYEGRNSQLDLTLPWDPVAKLPYVIDSQAMEHFLDSDGGNHDSDYLRIINTTHQKFILDRPFFDELERCIQQSPIDESRGSISSTSSDDNSGSTVYTCTPARCKQETIKRTVGGLTNQKKDEQVPPNSMEDFLFLRMGCCMATIKSNKDSNLISKPDPSEKQLEFPCSAPKKQHLICRRVPGALNGQTKLAFI